MLKSIESLDVLAFKKNDSSKPVSSKNNGSRPAFGKNNSNKQTFKKTIAIN